MTSVSPAEHPSRIRIRPKRPAHDSPMKKTTAIYIALATILLIALGIFYWVMLSNHSARVVKMEEDPEEEPVIVQESFDAVEEKAAPIANVAVPAGTNMVKNGDAEAGNTSGWKGFASTVPKPHEGAYAFILDRKKIAYTTELIPLDPEARYELSGFFTSEGGPTKVYLGFDCFDANKKRITSPQVTPIPGSETELVQDAKKGDKVLKIKDGSAWKFEKLAPLLGVVAFDVDPSGNYGDLPNRKISKRGITQIRKADGHWEVTLRQPMPMDYPAGTKVRQHREELTMRWAADKPLKENWISIKGTVSGISFGGQKVGMFWPGTRYIRVAILNETNAKPPAPKLLVDNVVLRVTK